VRTSAIRAYLDQQPTHQSFALDQISIVPDHIHMIVRIVPKMSIEEGWPLSFNEQPVNISSGNDTLSY